MKFLHLLTALLLSAPVSSALASDGATAAPATEKEAYAFPKEGERLREVHLPEVQKMIQNHDSELLVVNFWATWCAPCVAELPYFAEADSKFRNKGVRFVGLTLDNLTYEDWQDVSAETMKTRGVKYANFALDADPNEFVPWFAEEWVGAIPATFYFDKDGKKLGQRLREVTRQELVEDIEKYLPEETAEVTSESTDEVAEAEDQSSSSAEKS